MGYGSVDVVADVRWYRQEGSRACVDCVELLMHGVLICAGAGVVLRFDWIVFGGAVFGDR